MKKEVIKTFQYRITQATASQLVVILYDMFLEYIKDSCDAIDNDDAFSAKKNVNQAAKVIDELLVGLDMKYDISVNLFLIYNHIKRSLISASVSLDKSELNRVSNLIKKLRASFYEVSKQDESKPLMKNTEVVYAGLTYSKLGANETSLGDNNKRGFMA